jgi:hypothetical protein
MVGIYRTISEKIESVISMRMAALIIAFMAGAGAVHAQENPDQGAVLELVVSGSTRTVTQADLEKRLGTARLTVYSPVYQRPMTYQGFWLDEILEAYHIRLSEQDLVFESTDGFGASLSGDEIGRQKWLVAYGDPQGWTPLPERNKPTLPGPWYVVGRDPSTYNSFPWPYQVFALKVRADW